MQGEGESTANGRGTVFHKGRKRDVLFEFFPSLLMSSELL